MKYDPQNITKDIITNLFGYYELPLPGKQGSSFNRTTFSRDTLLGVFVVEYVKKYGGKTLEDIYTRTVNCMYGDVLIGISSIPDLAETLVSKVDVIEGMGLSENNFTDELKTKLDNIQEGGEVNVQSDWTETNSSSDAFIKNKPDLNLKVDKSSFDGTSGYVVSEYTTTPDVDNKTLSLVKTHTSVDGQETKTVPFDIKIGEGLDLVIVDGASVPTIEITADGVKQEADELKEDKVDKSSFDFSNGYVVSELTADLVDQTLTVKKYHTSVNEAEEIVYPLHLQAVDGLVLTPDASIPTEPVIKIGVPELSNKVDKVEGYALSKNDFTDDLLTKLDGVESGGQVNVQSDWNQTITTADDFIKNKPYLDISGIPGLTDALDSKVDDVDGMGLSEEDFTTELKTKLDNIQEGAEVNVQPDWNQTTTTADDFIKNKPLIVNDLTTGGSTSVASAETVKELKSQLSTAIGQQHLRGAVWNALTSSGTNNYGIDGTSITINNAGSGYAVGDAVFIPASTSQGVHSIDAIIVITAVSAGAVSSFTVSKVGDYETAGDAVVTAIGGSGTGLSFNVTWVTKPASTLANIQNPAANDIAFVLEDEVHNGETWQWAMMDYNGDGIYNWVPVTTVDVKARDFITNPITAAELATDAVTVAKIPDGAITGAKIDPTLLATMVNVQPDWNQTTTTAADFIKNKPNINFTGTGGYLSDVNFSTELNSKLEGIASGAEVNVQSDWNQTSTTADDYIKNKPTIPVAANNVKIGVIRENDNSSTTEIGSFTTNQSTAGNITISLATTTTSGLLKSADKTKLDTVLTEWYGTAAEYAAIGTKNANTLYNIYE